jgi:hypothetical protein
VNAVSTNQKVANSLSAIREADYHRLSLLLNRDTACTKRDVFVTNGEAECFVQIRSVHVVAGRTPPGFRGIGKRDAREDVPTLPIE